MNPVDLLIAAADVLQSLPPGEAMLQLKDSFFHNAEIPLTVRYKAMGVKDCLSLSLIHYICMACKDTDTAPF